MSGYGLVWVGRNGDQKVWLSVDILKIPKKLKAGIESHLACWILGVISHFPHTTSGGVRNKRNGRD